MITSCFQVGDGVVDEALRPSTAIGEPSPRERVFALLDRMAEIAGPRQGAPKILLVFARIAACDWVDGQLEVRVRPVDGGVAIESFVDDGLSLQRFKPPLAVGAPYDEMARAVGLQARLLAPLQLIGDIGEDGFRLRPDAGAPVSIAPVVVDAPVVVPKAPPVPVVKAKDDLAETVRRPIATRTPPRIGEVADPSVHDAPTKPPPPPSDPTRRKA